MDHTGSRPSSSLSLRAVFELRHVSFPPGLNHGRHPYFYRMDSDTRRGLYHDCDTRRPHPQGTTTGLSQRWRHEEAAAHGLNHRWRHEDAADHSTLTLRKVRAVFELRHPVKTARRGGVGTPIEKAGALFW